MTHAMLLTGVHVDSEGKAVRFRVENSWGPDACDKGYMVMSAAWFDGTSPVLLVSPKRFRSLLLDGVTLSSTSF